MISCHLFFWPVTHPIPYWGIFSFQMRFMDLHGGHMLDDRCFHVTCSSDLSYIRCHTGAYFHFKWDLWIFKEVTCSMIDDFMSPDLWFIIHSMPYWGILSFWMRFTNLGGVARLSLFARCMPRRWSIRYLYDDSSEEPLGSCPIRPTLLDT